MIGFVSTEVVIGIVVIGLVVIEVVIGAVERGFVFIEVVIGVVPIKVEHVGPFFIKETKFNT